MSLRFPLILIISASAATLLVVAWFIWLDQSPGQKAIDGKLEVSHSGIDRPLPLVVAPLRGELFQAAHAANASAVSIDAADAYLRRRPLDARAWIWASRIAQKKGNLKLAVGYLETAQRLSQRRYSLLNDVFIRYLELGEIDRAIEVGSGLSYLRPKSFNRVFSVLSRLVTDYKNLIARLVPPAPEGFDKDIYYRWALNYARKSDNFALADTIWSSTPPALQRKSLFGLHYLDYLVKKQDWSVVRSVWRALEGIAPEAGLVLNSGFEDPVEPNSPCWRPRETPGATWTWDKDAYQGERSILIEFNGEENVDYSHMSCVIPVEEHVDYLLGGIWKGEDITTLSGPFVDVYAPGGRRFYARSGAVTGSWPWTNWAFDFTPPEGVEIVILRFRRAQTTYLDSKISGKVWFDDVTLTKNNKLAPDD